MSFPVYVPVANAPCCGNNARHELHCVGPGRDEQLECGECGAVWNPWDAYAIGQITIELQPMTPRARLEAEYKRLHWRLVEIDAELEALG